MPNIPRDKEVLCTATEAEQLSKALQDAKIPYTWEPLWTRGGGVFRFTVPPATEGSEAHGETPSNPARLLS